jgi:hypothetical protein
MMRGPSVRIAQCYDRLNLRVSSSIVYRRLIVLDNYQIF